MMSCTARCSLKHPKRALWLLGGAPTSRALALVLVLPCPQPLPTACCFLIPPLGRFMEPPAPVSLPGPSVSPADNNSPLICAYETRNRCHSPS